MMAKRGKKKEPMGKLKQRPLRLVKAGKRETRSQFGALPWRLHDGKVEFLLITARKSGKWIIPKGWPMHGETPAGAAATEAYEEAGIDGKLGSQVIGIYAYSKKHGRDRMPIIVSLFPIQVKKLLSDYPERKERKRKWVSRKTAMAMVEEPELARIIRDFDPARVSN